MIFFTYRYQTSWNIKYWPILHEYRSIYFFTIWDISIQIFGCSLDSNWLKQWPLEKYWVPMRDDKFNKRNMLGKIFENIFPKSYNYILQFKNCKHPDIRIIYTVVFTKFILPKLISLLSLEITRAIIAEKKTTGWLTFFFFNFYSLCYLQTEINLQRSILVYLKNKYI